MMNSWRATLRKVGYVSQGLSRIWLVQNGADYENLGFTVRIGTVKIRHFSCGRIGGEHRHVTYGSAYAVWSDCGN